MRVVEPNQFASSKKKDKKIKLSVLPILIVVLVISGSLYYWKSAGKTPELQQIQSSDSSTQTDQVAVSNPDTIKDTLRQFTDNEFKVFYDNQLQPNLERVVNPPTITGNDIADARIRKLAEDRGYRLRSSPSVELVDVDGYPLQPTVASPWKVLKAASVQAGIKMSIVSGYRSVSDQRKLFTDRLFETGVSLTHVANGSADSEINLILQTTAIPGYSKHHTGYTFDLFCSGYIFENFKDSTCNDWLAADNYKIAKENGFIPSYPPLSDSQGPNPEAWEYIYVGTDLMIE